MKILPALFFLSISFTPFLASQALANDGPYEVLVVGYNYDTFMANLGGRAGYEYLKAMSQSSNSSSSYNGGSSSVSTAREKCLANADATKKACENAYSNLNSICNAYTSALGAFSARKFMEIIGIQLPGVVGTTITSTAGNVGYNTDFNTATPCSILVPMAMKFCATGAENMKNACPK